METPRISKSSKCPNIFIMLGDGTYYYNYDIQSNEITVIDPKTKETSVKTIFSFITVMLRGIPEYKYLVQAVIRAYLTQNEEFDLINSYNKAIALGQTEGKDITDYKGYLTLIDTIKTNIKKDLNII